MTKPRLWWLYFILVAPITAAYFGVREFVIAQEPTAEEVVISNLTLNYVLFALVIGALVPYYIKKRFFPKKPTIVIVPIALVVGIFLILLLKLFGMDMRF